MIYSREIARRKRIALAKWQQRDVKPLRSIARIDSKHAPLLREVLRNIGRRFGHKVDRPHR